MAQSVWGQRGVQSSAKDLLYPTASTLGDGGGFAAATAHPTKASTTPQVLCMSWNHDGSCLAIGTSDGFRVYSTEYIPSTTQPLNPSGSTPDEGGHHHRLVEVTNRVVAGGVRHIALHDQGSVVLFSGASQETESVVTLWDDAAVDGAAGERPLRSGPSPTAGGGDDDTGPLFRRPVTDSDVQSLCVIGRLQLTAPVAALRLQERMVVIAEPFRVHLYDTYLRHLDTLLTPNHGKRSASFSAKGDLGLVWDNGAQSIAVAAVEDLAPCASSSLPSPRNTTTTVPVIRALSLGPTVGSVRCIQYIISPGPIAAQQSGAAGSRHSRTTSSSSATAHGATIPGGGSSFSMTASGWTECKLVGPNPHAHPVQCLAISPDGALGLSCSIQGTAIKLIDTKRACLLRQFTRGITTSVIGCLSFSVDGRLAACIGRSGTVHVYWINPTAAHHGSSSDSNSGGRDGGGGRGGESPQQSKPAGGLSSFVSGGLRMLQGVAPAGALESLQGYLSSDYAISTFNLKIANADSDGLRLRASLSPADANNTTATSSSAAAATDAKANDHQRSAVSEAFLLQDEDNLQRALDVSEHSGFDPLFTALQFRPGFHPLLGTSAPLRGGGGGAVGGAASSLCYANLLLACGNVTPDGYGLKSKCIQVAVPLPSSIFAQNHHPHRKSDELQQHAGGGDIIEAPFVTHTSLFPKEAL